LAGLTSAGAAGVDGGGGGAVPVVFLTATTPALAPP
jgi:hypothetical protein